MSRPVDPTHEQFLHAAGEAMFYYTLGAKDRQGCAQYIAERLEVPLAQAQVLLADLEELHPRVSTWLLDP